MEEKNAFEDEEMKNQMIIECGLMKARLKSIEKRRKNKAIYILTILTSIGISYLFYFVHVFGDFYNGKPNIKISGIVITMTIGVFLATLMCVLIYLYYSTLENHIQNKIYESEILIVKEDVEENIFENSLELSYKYLDQYYNQTREQAQKGFWVTTCVAIFGGMLIFGGIIAMFFGQTTPSYITCASGVVTEFISTIFFSLYNKTVSSMSNYHDKLIYSQNISFALRVADSLQTEVQVNAKNTIVTELLKDINANIRGK